MDFHIPLGPVLRSIAIVLIIALSGCEDSSKLSSAEIILKAQAAIDREEYSAAIIMLKNVLRDDPGDVHARASLGRAHVANGDGVSAEKELRRAIELGADADSLAVDLARAYLIQGKLSEVVDLDWLNTSDPAEQARYAAIVADAHISLQDTESARDVIEKGLTLQPNSLDLNAVFARLQIEEEDYGAATELLNDLTSNHPEFGRAWSLLGDLYLKIGEPEKAIQPYQEAIESRTNKFSDLVKQTQAYLHLEQLEAAQDNVSRLKEIAPGDPNSLYLEGLLAIATGKQEQAITALSQVIQKNPNHGFAHYHLGSVYLTQGSNALATNHFEQAGRLMPDFMPARRALGFVEFQNRDLAGSIPKLSAVVGAQPDDLKAVDLLAAAYVQQKKPNDAISLLKPALDKNPENAQLWFRLASAQAMVGLPDEAFSSLRTALEADSDQQGAYTLMLALSSKDKAIGEKSIELLTELIGKNPDNAILRNHLGAHYRLVGDVEKAGTAYREAIRVDPKNLTARLNIAGIAMQQGKVDAAEQVFKEVVAIDQGNEHALVSLARLAANRNDPDQVDSLLRQAIEMNPDSVRPRLIMARLHLAAGRLDDAGAAIDPIREANSENAELLSLAGTIELARGALSSATRTLEQAAQLAPNSDHLAYLLSEAYARSGNDSGFESMLAKTLELNPQHVAANYTMARVKLIKQDIPAAQAHVDRLKKLAPQDAELFSLEATIAAQQGDLKKAMEKRRHAFDAQPTTARMIALARLMSGLNDEDGAIALQEQWVRSNPSDKEARLALAGDYASMRREEEAISQYNRVLQQDKNNIVALNNLAWLYQDRDLDKALAYAGQALDLAPESPVVMDTLSLLYLRAAQPDKALRFAERAVAKEPGNLTYQFRKARALISRGDTSRGKLLLQSLLDAQDEFPERQAAEQLLQSLR